MTIQEKIDALKEEFSEKIAKLEKQAKAEEKQSKVLKPKNGEGYYYMDSVGDENISYWTGNKVDHDRFILGNIFDTAEEVDWENQHRIVATELKHFVAENDPRPITEKDWQDAKIEKYICFYNNMDKQVDVTHVTYLRWANQIYASNFQVLQKAIEHIGEERLKKYYFGVEVE